jgi:hypothetical protein
MRIFNDEKGAVLIFELVVLAVVLVTAGFAMYQYVGHKNAASKAATPRPYAASLSPLPAKPSDPYASWPTFNGTCSGYSFKYPSDWKVSLANSFIGGQCQITTVESPSGNKLMWIPGYFGDGPGCDWSDMPGGKNDCPTEITLKSEDVALPGGVNGGYLTEQIVCNETKKCEGRVALAAGADGGPRFQVGTAQRYPVLVFGSHAMYLTQGKQTNISNPPQPIFNFDETSARAWLKSDDVQKAELAMKSLVAKPD